MKKLICNVLLISIIFLVIITEVRAGQILAWGNNEDGQCNIPAGDDFVAVATGRSHSLALKSDGSIVGWGDDRYGQSTSPKGNDFIRIAGGLWHSLALRSDGSIAAWGSNSYGESEAPDGNDFAAIEGGFLNSIVVKTDGSILGWGYNGEGQCNVPPGNDFVEVRTNGLYNAAIKIDGSLVAWGSCRDERCDVPIDSGFTDFAAGTFHGIAIRADGSLESWGINQHGEGDVPEGNDFIAVEAGRLFSLALKTDGSLIAWGLNDQGQCDVPSGNNFAAIASGRYHSLALNSKPSPLVGVEIIGLDEIRENMETQYEAIAHYADGTKRDATSQSTWRVRPDKFAEIEGGLLKTKDISKSHTIVVYAEYTEGEITLEGEIEVYFSLPRTFYVPSEYNTIQEAVHETMNFDSVVVADGIYTGGGNCNININEKAIYIRSENGAQNCIIDCQEQARGFYFTDSGEKASLLKGFTIINGRAQYYGGGVCSEYSSLTIENCIVRNNTATGGWLGNGGGIYCRGREENIFIIKNCTISENKSQYGGGLCCGGSFDGFGGTFVISNCLINDNIAEEDLWSKGGGIYCGGEGTNYGPGGIFLISNCILANNSSSNYGGAIYCDDDNIFTLTNTVIYNNTAQNGSGIYFTSSNPTIKNCTFSNNLTSDESGAIHLDHCWEVALTNSILWENQPMQILDDSTVDAEIVVQYCDIEGGWEGTGNISTNPLFVDSAGLDFHLLIGSPCIDAGDPEYPFDPNEADLDGALRMVDGNGDGKVCIDMGCYEYQPPIPVEVRITPSAINVNSKGRFVVAHIQMPDDLVVVENDIESIKLDEVIEAEDILIGQDRMITARFSRTTVTDYLIDSGFSVEVELAVTCRLMDGTIFEGKDTVTVRE